MSLPQKELTPEALKIFDRQRFIGLDVQRRLLNSRILLHPLNGVNTELAKNLVLCGCNLVLHDEGIVSEEDVETNFLISPANLGQKKVEIIREKLFEMNQMASIEIAEKIEDLKSFDIVAISTGNFQEMMKWEKASRELQKPVYFLWSCGFYGFFFASLGSEYRFRKSEKEKEDEECVLKPLDMEATLKSQLTKRNKDVFLGIRMMHFAEGNGWKREDLRLKWSDFLEEFKKKQQIKENQEKFLQDFTRMYGINFIPVYSVVGSVASQEFIKVVGKNQEPGVGWFCYDSEEGYAKFEKN